MDAALIRNLGGPQGTAIFADLPAEYSVEKAARANLRLRSAGHPADLVAAALTQWELRGRAGAKFGPAASTLFFTRDGLEQSTRALVADLHAEHFAEVGVQHIWDLGCGVGGDAMAFRRRGIAVTAVESDAVTAAVASANLEVTSGESAASAKVRTDDIEQLLPEIETDSVPTNAVWLDPARRTPGVGDATGRTARIRSPEDMSPSWDVVVRAARAATTAGVKVNAGFAAASLPMDVAAQWVCVDGSALECVLWWGAAASSLPPRSVSSHRRGQWHHLLGGASALAAATAHVRHVERSSVASGAFVYEVDPAVVAAGMRDHVCELIGAQPLGRVAYLYAPHQVVTPWARCWQVNEVLPLAPKAIRAWARRHDIGALTLKKPPSRSSSPLARLDPEALRAKINPHGSLSATLMLTEIDAAGSTAALWIEPRS